MKIDIAVIATIEEEYKAVKDVFQLQEKDLKFEKNYIYYYKEIESIKVAFFKFTERGNLNSSSETTEIIRNFSPRFIILVGIAGGVKNNIRLGDVAVSSNVEYYEYEKIDEKGQHPRPIPVQPPSIYLINIAKHLEENWRDKIKTPRPDGKPKEETKAVPGLILSGEKIRNIKLPNNLLERKPIAIETEAAGVARAVYLANPHPEYIVIKGISDYVEESQELREKWRTYASEASVAFAYGLIMQINKNFV